MTFSVVLFTLLVQGLTIRPLVAALGLSGRGQSPNVAAFERLQAQLIATQAAHRALTDPVTASDLGPDAHAQLLAAYDERATEIRAALDGLHVSDEELRAERMQIAQRKALQAEKDALLALRNRGTITSGIYRALAADVDARLLQLDETGDPDETASAMVADTDLTPGPSPSSGEGRTLRG